MLSATHNCACSFIMPPLEVSLVPLTEKHRASEINLQLLIRTQQTVRFSATDFYDAILIKHCSERERERALFGFPLFSNIGLIVCVSKHGCVVGCLYLCLFVCVCTYVCFSGTC